MRSMRCISLAAAFLLLLGTANVAIAQEETGNVYVKVLDTDGAPLPGVTVELTGMGAPRIMTTNTAGEVRFLGLDPGQVSLKASLEGFSTVEYPNVNVQVARNTSLEVQLSGAIGEVITVTSESPILDERKLSAGTTVTQVELESIPTARDPWSILNQTPSVVTDRINVGGNESGQQAVFRAPAVSDDENDFMVDGVQITDMAAIGSSSTYFDFDQFTEMQFATGGTDITKAAAGVSMNLVTKRGTNEFRGSGRYFLTDADGYYGALKQADSNIDDELAPGQESLSGNQMDRVLDYGFEAGGPVLRDRVWLWGSWGKNDIGMFAAGGLADNTFLENSAIKINAQLASANSLVGSFNNGEKQKFGRNAGPAFAADATWNQRGPTGIYKLEDTHIFSSNLFLTGTWSKVDGGFGVVPQGVVNAGCAGADCPFEVEPLFDDDFVRKNSYYQFNASRPSEEFKLDGSYFFNTGSSTSHELKYGGRYRAFESSTAFMYPGRNIAHYAGVWWGIGDPDIDVVEGARGSWPSVNQNYTSLWAQDTISLSKWTINAGLRWDIQDGENPAENIPANPAFPELLPAIDFPGNDADGLEWSTISPRIGVTYALGEERNTLIRGSYSRFAQALYNDAIGNLNPTGFSWAYLTFEDSNDNNMWDGPEETPHLFGWSGFDPDNPTAVSSPNRNDPGLAPAMTDELIIGAEHSLLPEFVVGATFTMRQVTDINDSLRLIRDQDGVERVETLNDYVVVREHEQTLPDGTVVRYPEWNLREELTPTGGTYLTNGGREREYSGIGLNWTKRLANQWMMRGFVNYALTDKWVVPGDFMTYDEGRNPTVSKSDCDGCVYAVQSTGSGNKSDVYLQTGWSWNLNGMYQITPDRPWGFNVAANLWGRQGTALPYYDTRTGPVDGIGRSISVVNDTDDFRVDDVFIADVRVEKEFAASSGISFTFSIDGFNVFNVNSVLQRERLLNGSRANYLDETVSPRIWRLGVRLNWR